MYDELLKQWANEQGFQTWSQDHAAVLRNLTSWLNQHAAQQSVQADKCPDCVGYGVMGIRLEPCKKCNGTGICR